MRFNIEAEIEATDIDQLSERLGKCPFPPFSYQWMTYRKTTEVIRDYKHPVVIKAAVSAGKTVMIAMVCKRAMQLNWPVLVLSLQGEIIDQDHTEIQNFGVPNSIFSASLGRRSAHFPVICGSTLTVVNALDGKLANFCPRIMLIDECHQVNVTDLVESERSDECDEVMQKEKRAAMTRIIRTLQARHRAKYNGKEMVIIGYTGTDYRGTEAIINTDPSTPGFWREKAVDISTEYLVKFGSVVPTHFGDVGDLGYDLDEFEASGEEGDGDFSAADMEAMQEKILAAGTMTKQIMRMMVDKTKDGGGVLVTCAGLKHCIEAAAALPEGETYAIVTQETTKADRKRALAGAYDGSIKWIFQVGCLTTGVNIPPWKYCLILRRIGSLTLLTQLIGRVMRKLKKEHEAAGMYKDCCEVWDFAGTMENMGELYFSEFLEQYQHDIAIANKATRECPKCGALNSKFARRCINEDADSPDGRCEHFWKSRTCDDLKHPRLSRIVLHEGCGAENDIAARFCRLCGNILIDPNKKLSGKAYSADDYCNVASFKIKPSSNGEGVVFSYVLEDPSTQQQFKASEVFYPFQDGHGSRAAWMEGAVNKHIMLPAVRKQVLRCKSVAEVMALSSAFLAPSRVTHRRIDNDRKDAISRKQFDMGEL